MIVKTSLESNLNKQHILLQIPYFYKKTLANYLIWKTC